MYIYIYINKDTVLCYSICYSANVIINTNKLKTYIYIYIYMLFRTRASASVSSTPSSVRSPISTNSYGFLGAPNLGPPSS